VRRFAIALWAGQVLAAGIMLIAAAIQIFSILGTGPTLSAIGLALAFTTRRVDSWQPVAFGLSAPVVCAFNAAVIGIGKLGPHEAAHPVAIILALYILAAIPLALLALRSIRRWQLTQIPGEPTVWQYSMRSMLVWMTAVCMLVGAGQFVVRWLMENHQRLDGFIFLGFALTAILLSSVVLWRFVAKRPGRKQIESADG
jgi:hypothetical protein